jgi:hypothetical protein
MIPAFLLTAALSWLLYRIVDGPHVFPAAWSGVPAAVGLALGLLSITWFWSSGLGAGQAIWMVEGLLLALLGSWWWWRGSDSEDAGVDPPSPAEELTGKSGRRVRVVLVALLILNFLLLAFSFATEFGLHPYGGWDGWAIWNNRARFLFRSDAPWERAFSGLQDWSHPDYPLLLPAGIARLWSLAGAEAVWAAPLLAVFFSVGSPWLVYGSVRRALGKGRALVALLVFASFGAALRHGASQYADTALAFYILLTLISSARYDDEEGADPRQALLAGFAAGCAGWTKNEGLLFLVVFLWLRVAAHLRRGSAASARREFGALGAGLLLPLATLLFFKLRLAPPGDFSAALHGGAWHQLADLERWLLIATAFAGQLATPACAFLATVAMSASLLGGWRSTAPRRQVAGLLPLLFSGYFLVYLLTPRELAWHLETSLERLVFQIWPAVVWGVAMGLAPLEPVRDSDRERASRG